MKEFFIDRVPIEIGSAMLVKKMDKRQVAKMSGIPYQTLCRRLREPGTMTVAELTNISTVLGIKWGAT